jgi:uncharacterized protein YbjQ (UPF0145 family)
VFSIRYGVALSMLLLFTPQAIARNDAIMMPIARAMATAGAQLDLAASVKLFFGTTPTAPIGQDFGKVATLRRTSLTENGPCERVFVAALVDLQKRATAVGANAVINIVSYYNQQEFSSQDQYECHRGAAVTGVALRGDMVRLADR